MRAGRRKRFGWVAAVLLSLPLICAEQTMSKQPGKPGGVSDTSISPSARTEVREEARKVRIYELLHADPLAVAHVISAVMVPGPRVATPGKHELIVAGTNEQFAAVEQLLKQLDQPPAAPPRPAYVTLKYPLPPSSELMPLLRSAVSPGTSIAFDPVSRTILVRGSDADIAAVQQLAELIDKPTPVAQASRALELTFFFLKSPSSGPRERVPRPVPAFLDPVVQALADNGFRYPSLMTPLIVRTQENDKFAASGALTQAVAEAAVDRATQDKLGQVVPEVDLTNVTLERAIGYVRDVGRVNIVVRWNTLEFAGIGRDTEVSIQLKNVALEKVLGYILDSVSTLVGIDVGYVLDDGVLIISTREGLREKYGSRQPALQVRVQGKARILESGKSAQLDVEANVCLPPSAAPPAAMGGGPARPAQSLFRVETVFTVPLGEYVVLAAGPVSPDVGQGIAMVVRAEAVGGSTGSEAAAPAAAKGTAPPPGARRR